MDEPVVVIVNPKARLVGEAVSLAALEQGLREAGLRYTLRLVQAPGEGEQFAREAVATGVRRLIVAGGDGTINEAVQALAGSATELAIVPLGTGNVLARSLGLREGDLRTACLVAAHGRVRRVDLGRMNGRYFVAIAGVGLDAAIVQHLDGGWKQRIGKFAYMFEFVRRVWAEQPRTFRLDIDGRYMAGPMWGVLITNTNEYTWRVRPVREPRADDGRLDAVLIHRQGSLKLFDLAGRMFFGGQTAEGHPTASVVRFGRLHIEAEPPAPWQAEGDVYGTTPVRVTVVPQALALVTPEAES